ncbi:MAG TPA: MarR family winged helix-turn-helix transcriptional regulator [Thermoanaerobaculia bacterium]|nr:MarR family winged helix-turn-helix transcriptional regulator [Thermoanaerobaculia bacterium]
MATSRKGDDAHRVLNAFRNLVKMLRLADRAAVKRYGLGSAQIFVLHELSRTSPLSVNELADRTVTDQSTVSVVVNKLVRKGYVENTRSDADGRRAELALTSKGRQVVKKLPPPIQQLLIDGVRSLPAAQARRLAETLDLIVSAVGGGEEPPPMFFEEGPAKRH